MNVATSTGRLSKGSLWSVERETQICIWKCGESHVLLLEEMLDGDSSNSVIFVAGSVDEKHSEDPYFSFIIRLEGSGQSNLLVVIMINILCLKTHISQVMHGPPVPADLPLC